MRRKYTSVVLATVVKSNYRWWNFWKRSGNIQEMETMKHEKKLYSQNEMADILGITHGAFSKWLKRNGVSPETTRKRQKLYDETVISMYKKSKKAGNRSSAKTLTTVELLKAEVQRQQEEINRLNEKLDHKDQQIQAKDELIADYGLRFAKLADQAQQLNLTDKDQKKLEMLKGKNNLSSDNPEKTEDENDVSNYRWWNFWKRKRKQ